MRGGNQWFGLVGGILVIALACILLSVLLLFPILLIAVIGLAKLQDKVINVLVGSIMSIAGVEAEEDPKVLTFALSALFGATLFAVGYVTWLVGTHASTVILLTLLGATVSLVLLLVADLGSDESRDLLSTLRFWDGQE